MDNIAYINELLKVKHNTEYNPFELSLVLKCYFIPVISNECFHATINVKYLYLRDNTSFAANSSYDEVAIECLNEDSIKKIVEILNQKESDDMFF